MRSSANFADGPIIRARLSAEFCLLASAIAKGAGTTQAIDPSLSAGTNLGSRLPRLLKMILAAAHE
jgi:hypothetical protein